MTRPTSPVAALRRRTVKSRELVAERVLAIGTVMEAAAEAAGKGVCSLLVPLGPASLEGTPAAKTLAEHLAGAILEWEVQVDALRNEQWFLRITWR